MKKYLLMLLLFIPFMVNASDYDFEEISSTTKYYKTITNYNNLYTINSFSNISNSYTIEISENEYNNPNDYSLQDYTTIETNYKKMTTTILSNGSYFRYKVNLYWKNIPKVRSYDTISISHYESVKLRGTPDFKQVYCTSSGCKTLSTYYRNVFSKGVAATFKIPNGDLTSLEQTLYFDVQKNVLDADIIEQKAIGDYAHATSDISSSNAQKFELGLSGILLDYTIKTSYDEINPAVVTWNGIW